jgi:hypothetical protein
MLKKIQNLILIGLFFTTTGVLAGSSLPVPPDPDASAYNLLDIYYKISSSTFSYSAHTFAPTTTPDSTFVTLADIWNAIPPINVLEVDSLDSGVLVGGIYASSTDLLTIEPNLLSEKIATGTNIFGVMGSCLGPQIPTDSLVSYWPFDGNADDSVGNNDLSLAGNTSLAIGKDGEADTAYNFDGSGDYLYCTDANCGGTGKLDYIYGTGWTWGEWINPTSLGAIPHYNALLIGNRNAANTQGWNMVLNADGYVGCQVWTASGGNCGVNVFGLIATSTWSHVMCTHDGSEIVIYVNGEEAGSSTSQCSGLGSDSAGDFRIAKDNHAIVIDYNGRVDDARVYSRALTPEEVQTIYDLERP